jgi:hypothetical protein
MPKGMMAGLMRREGESWGDLLLRLNEAVMQSVVENRVVNELHLQQNTAKRGPQWSRSA